jgi:hypothetical protein
VGLLEASPADEAARQGDEAVVESEASFPSDGEAFELVEEGEGLLDDVAEFVKLRLSFAKFSRAACLLPVGHEEVLQDLDKPRRLLLGRVVAAVVKDDPRDVVGRQPHRLGGIRAAPQRAA